MSARDYCDMETDAEECPDCQGGGTVVSDHPRHHDLETTCARCAGSGYLPPEPDDDREAIAEGDYRYYRTPGAGGPG